MANLQIGAVVGVVFLDGPFQFYGFFPASLRLRARNPQFSLGALVVFLCALCVKTPQAENLPSFSAKLLRFGV